MPRGNCGLAAGRCLVFAWSGNCLGSVVVAYPAVSSTDNAVLGFGFARAKLAALSYSTPNARKRCVFGAHAAGQL